MNTKFRLLALAFAVITISLQCTSEKIEIDNLPTTIDQYFKAGSFSHEGETLYYQECQLHTSLSGDAPLVIALHGQYANGSDNKSQLHHDAMVKIWDYLNSSNAKVVMLVPQCPMESEWDENPNKRNKLTMPELLKATIDGYVKKQANIDTSRIYILGYSDGYKPAGAGGVWRMLSEYPDMFAAGMVVAADPDDSISAAKIAKTPVLLVKGESDIYAVSNTLDTFADWVRDAGGVIREDIIQVGTRDELCSEAFSTERLDWVMQYRK